MSLALKIVLNIWQVPFSVASQLFIFGTIFQPRTLSFDIQARRKGFIQQITEL